MRLQLVYNGLTNHDSIELKSVDLREIRLHIPI